LFMLQLQRLLRLRQHVQAPRTETSVGRDGYLQQNTFLEDEKLPFIIYYA
jgi:hypothetical protein